METGVYVVLEVTSHLALQSPFDTAILMEHTRVYASLSASSAPIAEVVDARANVDPSYDTSRAAAVLLSQCTCVLAQQRVAARV